MMTRRLSAFRSSRTFQLHASPHPAFDRMRFLFTMSEIEDRKERRRIDVLVAGRSAFVTLSTHVLNETDKSHRKDRNASICSTLVKTSKPRLWWSQTGSNRRPHACKARALPTELWPRHDPPTPKGQSWWAWEDLNLRPHAYQARALTN